MFKPYTLSIYFIYLSLLLLQIRNCFLEEPSYKSHARYKADDREPSIELKTSSRHRKTQQLSVASRNAPANRLSRCAQLPNPHKASRRKDDPSSFPYSNPYAFEVNESCEEAGSHPGGKRSLSQSYLPVDTKETKKMPRYDYKPSRFY